MSATVAGYFPQVLTHYDFHDGNIGTVGDQAVVIDWAYVGWGPVGHDVGHLAMTLESPDAPATPQAWQTLQSAYCDALTEAGWDGDLEIVRRSMIISNQLRFGWAIDSLLDPIDRAADEQIAVQSQRLMLLAGLGA